MIEAIKVPYKAAGLDLVGTLAMPHGDDRVPGVLIAHEGGGLDSYQRRRAALFANQGYGTFAFDYHGPHAPFASRDDMVARRTQLMSDAVTVRELARCAHDILADDARIDQTRIAAVGYCLGGALVLEHARSGADLCGVVALHPALVPITPEDSAQIRCEVLVHVGSDDPLVPLDDRVAFEREMSEAGVSWQMHVYGSVRHSYTNESIIDRPSEALAFDRSAAEHTSESVETFLARVLCDERVERSER